MGTFVYEQLSLVPEEHRWMLIDELTSQGIVNCWFIAGLLYKVKLAEREATGPMDISNDLDEYQERLERLAEEEESERDGERAGRLFAASGSSRDEDEYDDDADDADARRDAAFDAARAGVQVFEGRAANVPGGPLIDRFQKVFYPAPEDPGTWHGRVAVKKPRIVEKYLPLYFRTNDTLERFVKVPATAEDADLLLDYQNPPYLEADMPPGMAYPSRMTAGEESGDVVAHPEDAPSRRSTRWWIICGPSTRRVRGAGVERGRGRGRVSHLHPRSEVRRARVAVSRERGSASDEAAKEYNSPDAR